jgi:S-DNA-T family DNA segregation ATPase FtsK/SpoIIIE
VLVETLTYLFGEYYRPIFIVYAALAVGIAIGKLSWNGVRVIGLLLYSVSIVSLFTAFTPYASHGVLDFSVIFTGWFGRSPMILAFVVGLLVSLYLTLRISYRKIFAAVHSRLPSVNVVRDTMTSFRGEIAADKPVKTYAAIEARKKDLEKELEAARKERELEKQKIDSKQLTLATQHVPIQKKEPSLLEGIFGKSTAIPLIKLRGDVKEAPKSDKEAPKSDKEAHKTNKTPDFGEWEYPPSSLLAKIEHKASVSPAEIREKSAEIENTLLQFKIGVKMMGEKVGPTVVQYRLEPDDGVKLSKIENLKKDLTLSLKAKSIRIQAPIPGLGLVGIEVPNDKREMIGIREVIEHSSFVNFKPKLALVIGKDINGEYIIGDMSKMPHLLIAGQTGSGKSVVLNGLLVSLLYKNSPSTLRLILIDPKRVELGMYNGIPHLLTPVINEPDKALNSLKWAVAEMIRRYDLLNVSKVRNLAEYNAKVGRKDQMPNIIIVVEELNDLMMSGNKKEVENTIARIAQMARAVGMHLIIATQRPSVDVITGIIKANIPSRIALTVASLVDSRTILDRMGAEDLLGNGDMLYSPSGCMSPDRIQGVYVSTEEVEAVVNHIKRTIDPEMLEDIYDASIVEGDQGNWEGSTGGGGAEGGYDEDPKVIDEAIAFVRASGKASTSMLQRRMKLGYARAARVMDILEEMGVVGPADGSKPRDVL